MTRVGECGNDAWFAGFPLFSRSAGMTVGGGAARENRTPDLLITNQPLCQTELWRRAKNNCNRQKLIVTDRGARRGFVLEWGDACDSFCARGGEEAPALQHRRRRQPAAAGRAFYRAPRFLQSGRRRGRGGFPAGLAAAGTLGFARGATFGGGQARRAQCPPHRRGAGVVPPLPPPARTTVPKKAAGAKL